jgi:hypothetical protein
MEKVKFWEEKPGHQSSIRLQMFLTLIFAFCVIGYQTIVNENHVPDFLTMLVLLTAAFAPKLLQKFAELKQ